MSEPIWCSINFRAPVAWTDWVENRLPQYLEYRDDPIVEDGVAWWSFGLEGNYGLWDDDIESLLDALTEHKVPYVAQSDPKYEYIGERRVFNGHTGVTYYGSCAGDEAAMTYGLYADIQARRSAYESVDDYFDHMNRNVADLPIEHLQPWPPPDPDDALSFDECEDAGVDGSLRDM